MTSDTLIPWNPLSVAISAATDSDLLALQEVPESWHIEYKAQINQEPRKIAKEIAAFANTFGGYLIYGIKEHDDSPRRAQHYLGIPDGQISAAEVAIRNAVAQHLTPPPYFEVHRVPGKGKAAPLGTTILIVSVPPALDAPIIHSSGVIFRRVADSSEPNPETDRLVVDALVRRRDQGESDVRDFIQLLPEQVKNNMSRPTLCYSIVPSPFSPISPPDTTFESMSQIFLQKDPELVEFDSVFPLGSKIVAQLVGPLSRRSFSVTAEVDRWTGRIRVTLPLNSFPLDQRGEFALAAGYDHRLFSDLAPRAGRTLDADHRFIDINDIARMTLGIGARLAKVAELLAPDHRWYGSATLIGCYHASPWAAGSRFRDHVSANGLPLVSQSVITSSTSFSSMAQLWDDDSPFTIAPLALDALELLGIPTKLVQDAILEWSKAGREATNRRTASLAGRP